MQENKTSVTIAYMTILSKRFLQSRNRRLTQNVLKIKNKRYLNLKNTINFL